MNKIEELENKMLEIAQEIAELKKGQNAGEWKPQEGEEYWCMDLDGVPYITRFNSSSRFDIWRVNNIPVFKTLEECEKYIDYRKALSEKSYKFSREEWDDNSIDKYMIYYDYCCSQWCINDHTYCSGVGVYNFKTEEDAQYMIDNYSEEMLKWGLL